MPYIIAQATAQDADVIALLVRHLQMMQAQSPPESCHVMNPASLFDAGAIVLAARESDVVLGVGALKPLDAQHGELKSMHTAAEARGRGIAQAVLGALIAQARTRGLTRLSLETGATQLFAPARALYARNGFEECQPFGKYDLDPLSVFMTRHL
ncbi:GNAT family N-acetyltransferase [Pseudosulfitobacter sp. DSM 107133]|uniref:GNAT family N-acetyltransferase n=1 Tax=Pseudosulfitobacter sp. DSM 107133 TaxID=2883100 RepID=UPI000DF39B46|nr:GNAT family N-acetyltransferase [Pseudosulfitobacter sp. DSM 107133]UOA25760.1 putative N-acetyltransferase YsnE [Pseudosulfitobacter sp. DSM 107133]